MMTKEGSIKVANYLTPGAWIRALGRSHIIHIKYIV